MFSQRNLQRNALGIPMDIEWNLGVEEEEEDKEEKEAD